MRIPSRKLSCVAVLPLQSTGERASLPPRDFFGLSTLYAGGPLSILWVATLVINMTYLCNFFGNSLAMKITITITSTCIPNRIDSREM